MKYLIIGGVAGGATAAARIRRIDEFSEIVLLEKGKYISYANCGLPYYIGGAIAGRERLFVQKPESFGRRFKIDVRVENEVVAIDPSRQTVTVRRADGSSYTENYDKLLLSPGASAVERDRQQRDLHAPRCRRYRPDQNVHHFAQDRKRSDCRSRIYRSGDG